MEPGAWSFQSSVWPLDGTGTDSRTQSGVCSGIANETGSPPNRAVLLTKADIIIALGSGGINNVPFTIGHNQAMFAGISTLCPSDPSPNHLSQRSLILFYNQTIIIIGNQTKFTHVLVEDNLLFHIRIRALKQLYWHTVNHFLNSLELLFTPEEWRHTLMTSLYRPNPW